MKIELRALSEDNIEQCFKLKVAGDQMQYIASNEDSWKTAKENGKVARPIAIYCDGKIFGLICDDRFFVKPTEAGRQLLRTIEMRKPYDGAKDYFYIADVDDRDYLSSLVRETCRHLPAPKKKK